MTRLLILSVLSKVNFLVKSHHVFKRLMRSEIDGSVIMALLNPLAFQRLVYKSIVKVILNDKIDFSEFDSKGERPSVKGIIFTLKGIILT